MMIKLKKCCNVNQSNKRSKKWNRIVKLWFVHACAEISMATSQGRWRRLPRSSSCKVRISDQWTGKEWRRQSGSNHSKKFIINSGAIKHRLKFLKLIAVNGTYWYLKNHVEQLNIDSLHLPGLRVAWQPEMLRPEFTTVWSSPIN